MATYYVATTGNNGAAGTIGAPWKTINYGASQLSPGDTLYIRGGTYYGDGSGNPVVINRSGTSGNPITVAGYTGETVYIDGRAGVDGQNTGIPKTGSVKIANLAPYTGQEGYEGGLFDINGAYVNVSNLTIKRSMGKGLRIFSKEWWNRTGNPKCHTVNVTDVTVEESRRHNSLINHAKNVTLTRVTLTKSGNYFPMMRNASPATDWSACVPINNCEYVTLTDCVIHTNYGEGIITDSNKNNSSNVTIDGCTIYNGMVALVSIHGASETTVKNCLIFDTADWDGRDEGIIVIPSEPGLIGADGQIVETRGVYIYNNVIFGTLEGIEFGAPRLDSTGTHDAYVYYNTVVNIRGEKPLKLNTGVLSNIVIKNNIFWQPNGAQALSTPNPGLMSGADYTADYNAWSATPSYVSGANDIVNSNLGLVNPTHRPSTAGAVNVANFKPKSTSPVLNQGVALAGYTTDYDGSARGTPPEIGAFEYGGSAPPAVTAVVGASPTSGNAPLAVTLDGTGSTTAGGDTISGYSWTVWEPVTGTTYAATGSGPSVTLSTPGQWSVALTVTGASGATDTATETAYITVSEEQDPNPGTSGKVVYDVVEITQPAATGTQAVSHSLGTTPKAVFIFGSGGTVYGTAANDAELIAGYSDATEHRAATMISEHNTTPADNGYIQSASYCVITADEDDVSINSAATVSATSTTDFTLNWTAVDGVQRKLFALVVGGPGVSATVTDLTLGASGNAVGYDTGHQVDVVISATNLRTLDSASGAALMSLGMALSDGTQGSISYINRLSKSPTEVTMRADDSDGGYHPVKNISINWTISGSTVYATPTGGDVDGVATFLALGLDGITLNLDTLDTPVSAGNTDYEGLAEEAGFVLAFLSNLTAADTTTISGDLGVIGIYASDGTTGGTAAIYSEDNVATSDEQSYSHNKFVLPDSDGTLLVSGSTSMIGTGWRFTSDATPDTTARKMLVLAAGKSAATATPTAGFTWSPVTPVTDETITFTDLSDPNGVAGTESWSWDFGDASGTSTSQNPTYSYSTAGTYDVELTYTVGAASNVTTRTVTVSDLDVTASFTVSDGEGTPPHSVTIDGTASSNEDTYAWIIVSDEDVPDNWTSIDTDDLDEAGATYYENTASSFTYIFQAIGSYTVQLTASNSSSGNSDIEMVRGAVVVSGTAPTAGFTPDSTSGAAPLTVTLTGGDTPEGLDIIQSYYTITEVDGTVYTIHDDDLDWTFWQVGDNTVTRTVETSAGTSTTAATTITVSDWTSAMIGPPLPATSGAKTGNTLVPVSSQPYDRHTHYIDATKTGVRDTIVKTDYQGATQLQGLGLGMAPGDISDVTLGRRRLWVNGWIDFANAELYNRGLNATDGRLNLWARDEVVFNPGSRFVTPDRPNYHMLGSREKPWLALYAAELNVQTIVARNVIATIGGSILVAPTEKLIFQLKAATTDPGPGGYGSIHVANAFARKYDYLLLKEWDRVEYIQVTSDPRRNSADTHYIYDVSRNEEGDPDGAEYWPPGQAVVNVGGKEFHDSAGNPQASPSVGHGGMIDIYAENPVTEYESGEQHTWGPTIVGRIRNSAAYYDLVPMWAIGNLNQMYGYSGDVVGIGLGKWIEGTAAAYLTIDQTNGVRFHSNNAVVMTLDDDTGLNIVSDTVDSQYRHLSFTNTSGTEHSWIGATIASATNKLNIQVEKITGKGSYAYVIADAPSGEEAWNQASTWQNGTQKTTIAQWYDATNAIGYIYLNSGNGSVQVLNSYLYVDGIGTTPPAPSGLDGGNIYIRGGKLIVQYVDSGTTRYKYLTLTGTGTTWTHTTTAPT